MSISLASVSAFAVAVTPAHDVDFSAYTLRAGEVRSALVRAAAAGGHVRVRLERDPFDDAAGSLHRANAESVAVLTAAGADAALSDAAAPVLHLKAAVVDGIGWLDDRNWAGGRAETVIRDTDAAEVAAIANALRGGHGSSGQLATDKAGALALEADLIRSAGPAPVVVESESFGSSPVSNALLARARAGLPTRLLVAAREATAVGTAGEAERRRLGKLAAFGVEVRTGKTAGQDFDEKLAVAGPAGWAGSANATFAYGPAGDQRDWGLLTRDESIVRGLRANFEANWQAATPFVAAPR